MENKDKFLTKTIKRKDFNDGARQIEHDFANNVPLEEVIGVPVDGPEVRRHFLLYLHQKIYFCNTTCFVLFV